MPQNSGEAEGGKRMKYRSLVFDDDVQVNTLLKMILKTREHEVFVIQDPNESPLTKVESFGCNENHAIADFAFIDLHMPETPGPELVQELRRKQGRVHCMALISGDYSNADLDFARRHGCKVIRKPFDIACLETWVEACEEDIPQDRVLDPWISEN
jgi:DNA-binding response OmpR family regulator